MSFTRREVEDLLVGSAFPLCKLSVQPAGDGSAFTVVDIEMKEDSTRWRFVAPTLEVLAQQLDTHRAYYAEHMLVKP